MEVLGIERSADELIPMLTELIDKIDNNIELMSIMAVQLGKLTKLMGREKCISLCGPLELIAFSDDVGVWAKTVESLIMIQEYVAEDIHNTQFVDLIERLSKGELYSMKIAAAPLISRSYWRGGEDER